MPKFVRALLDFFNPYKRPPAPPCPITEWAEGVTDGRPLDTEVMTYREFLARQEARRKGSV